MHPTVYGAWWALPFILLLLATALLPMLRPRLWHRHQGKVALGCALAFLLPDAWLHGAPATGELALHALLGEYLPFVLLLGALYAIGGGISLRGNLHGSARSNLLLLSAGTVLASVMGTTGAAMLMVRPVLRANDARRHRSHVMVFFIFLVANAGGALTPLGDPPLFLGFLRGVGFFWTLRHMLAPTAVLCAALLAVFYLLDRWYWRQEAEALPVDPTPDAPLRLRGGWNLLWLAGVTAALLLGGLWQAPFGVRLPGMRLPGQQLLRDALLLALTLLSLATTSREVRRENHFEWGPMAEVARLFLGIFLSIIPVLAMLRAGLDGPLAPLVRLAGDGAGQPLAARYFWLTGGLSALLDNAPTYLVFFNLAGGDAPRLMREATVLGAISGGAVFMGAMTYLGNAPNLMVRAIARQRGVDMPGFFGYLGWALAVLLPLLIVVQWLFWP